MDIDTSYRSLERFSFRFSLLLIHSSFRFQLWRYSILLFSFYDVVACSLIEPCFWLVALLNQLAIFPKSAKKSRRKFGDDSNLIWTTHMVWVSSLEYWRLVWIVVRRRRERKTRCMHYLRKSESPRRSKPTPAHLLLDNLDSYSSTLTILSLISRYPIYQLS